MRAAFILIMVSMLGPQRGVGQWGHMDDSLFASRIHAAAEARYDTLPIGERVAAMGRLALGTPYVGGTLDGDTSGESLVINLHGLDCVTFYETSLAFARVMKSTPHPTTAAFSRTLLHLRYRADVPHGFHSRLHYTTDYFYTNAERNHLRMVTEEVGGRFARKETRTIDFMSHHRSLYKQMANNDSEFAGIVAMEKMLNARERQWFIPKEDVERVEHGIHTGDILGITTNVPGLDYSHTGIAIRLADGRIHFMHASSAMGRVIISEDPLSEYLSHNSHQTGISIARPVEVTSQSE